jgi:hypothetical protein
VDGLYGSSAYTNYPVMLLCYQTDDGVLVLDLVTLETACLHGEQVPQGEPFTLSIQVGQEEEILDELLRGWVTSDEVLHLSFEPTEDGGRLVLESTSVMIVLRPQPTLYDSE